MKTVNEAGSRIIGERNLWACLWGMSGLTEVGKPTLSVGGTISWAGLLDQIEWRTQLNIIPRCSAVWLQMWRDLLPPTPVAVMSLVLRLGAKLNSPLNSIIPQQQASFPQQQDKGLRWSPSPTLFLLFLSSDFCSFLFWFKCPMWPSVRACGAHSVWERCGNVGSGVLMDKVGH